MYYKYLTEEQMEKVKRIQEKTVHNYELKGNFMPEKSLWWMVEDLLCELESKEEELENYKQYVADNYRQLTDEEIYG